MKFKGTILKDKEKGTITVVPIQQKSVANLASGSYSITIEKVSSGKSLKQNATYWALVTLFCQYHGQKELVDESEKRFMSLCLLVNHGKEELGIKITDIKLYNKPEMTTLLNNLFCELASLTDKPYFMANEASDYFINFQEYLGFMDLDPLDECHTMAEWRDKHNVSQASGEGGTLHLHHIHSRKARPDLEDQMWNWLMLTAIEHLHLHTVGQVAFIKEYPHLRGRFARADKLACKGSNE